jgi:XTP/dITP diphosphohydrolase
MDLYFATGNENKVREIQAVIPAWITLKSINELGVEEDIPETSPTISGNSLQKAEYIFNRFHKPCQSAK